MPALRDFLARFRPAGSPGAAARAGVPADRSRDLEAELGPVLAMMDGTDAERERIIAQARSDAEQIVAQARAEAAGIAVDAARRAEAAREEAARQVMAQAREEVARVVADAAQQAARTRQLAQQRMPALVSRAVDTIRQLRSEAS
jgi:vacuolar-type H+-ATPase subunit H